MPDFYALWPPRGGGLGVGVHVASACGYERLALPVRSA